LKQVNLDLSPIWISGIICHLEKNLNVISKGKAMDAEGLNSLFHKSKGKVSIHFDNLEFPLVLFPSFPSESAEQMCREGLSGIFPNLISQGE
jgi:hypothetical protein